MDTIPDFMEKLRGAKRNPFGAGRHAFAPDEEAGVGAPAPSPAEAPAPTGASRTAADDTAAPPRDGGPYLREAGSPAAEGGPPALGGILVEAGRLSTADVDRVTSEQAANGGPFGAVAVRLGLITQDDVDRALARQFEYPCLAPDSGSIERSVITAYDPYSEAAEHLRGLRSQLMLNWLNGGGGRKSLAIASPGRGDGRSFVAANLAVLFAQMGARTLLIDTDLRHPAQDALFHLDNRVGLSALLAGRAAGEAIVRIRPLRNLFVLPAGPRPPNPQELLGRPTFARQLRSLEGPFDVVIADTTAAEAGADGQLVAAASGATVMVVREDVTPMKALRTFHAALDTCGSRVLGAVINRR